LALTLAVRAHSAYIDAAKLCRASGAIYPRGLMDPSGNCPWPGPWTWSHGAHLLSSGTPGSSAPTALAASHFIFPSIFFGSWLHPSRRPQERAPQDEVLMV